MEVNAFQDTIFFGNLFCLLEEGDDIYFTDHQNVRIMRTDKELNVLNVIGRSHGRGPKDLGYIQYFDVEGDTLWVGDVWKQAFVRLTTAGEFVDVVEHSNRRFTASARTTIDGRNIYFSKSDIKTGTSLAALNMQTDDYKPFGKSHDFGNPTKNEMMNYYHVFTDNDWIIAVPRSIPAIEIYDKRTLELVQSYDMLQFPQIKAIYEMSRNDPNMASPNSFYFLFTDAYLSGQDLYLLVNVYEGDSLHSEVLVLNVRDEMKLLRQYRFDEDTFVLTICATTDYVYAFVPQLNSIRRYPLR